MSETALVTIRPAMPQDVSTVRYFINALAEYEKLSDEVVVTEAQLQQAMFADDAHIEVLIGECDGEPAGFSLFYKNFSTFLGRSGIYIEDIYVHPPFRGKGIGTRFLLHIAKLAYERGLGRVEWSVLDWNRDAIDFYLKNYAKPMDDWTVYRVAGDALKQLAQQAV